jgi:hypothetical protein
MGTGDAMEASTGWSRRSVLVLAASSAGAMALAGPLSSVASATTTAPGSTASALTGLRRDHWTPLVGKTVAVDTPEGRVRVTVAEVEDLRSAPEGDPVRFAVELRTDRSRAIAGLYPITIPGRGVTTLLISAVDRGVRPRSSQIVVNNPAR